MSDTQNPYENLPADRFWKTGVASQSAFDIRGLWKPKFQFLPKHRIVTAGSCFAQHIGRALSSRGYGWWDAEPAPPGLHPNNHAKYNYGIFSFRTGNIYTVSALRQWVAWALGEEEPPTEIWEKDGRFYDPFRPAIEPGGFASPEELHASRAATLAAISNGIANTNFFVFTLGLTESWRNIKHGYDYAMCPGTLAGEFNPDEHVFINQDYDTIRADMRATLRMMRRRKGALKVLLTVSPVPLTATASGQHVLSATVHSKSILRAVAGEAHATMKFVDYFPSYEIITSTPYRSMFFEPNMRSVSPAGVALVMQNFFDDQETAFGPVKLPKKKAAAAKAPARRKPADIVCEEEMLDAFGS